MYYPYLYGRRSEMLALRAVAKKIVNKNRVVPVIEPVKTDISSLGKTIDALVKAGSSAIVVTNPHLGDFKTKSATDKNKWVANLLKDFPLLKQCTPALKITAKSNLNEVSNFLAVNKGVVALIHWAELAGLKALIDAEASRIHHHFIETRTSSLYRDSFAGTKILARDGFTSAERNADYPADEIYDDLNLKYLSQPGVSGFSDFTITGSNFKEGGGPAHAVAIHLTYERPTKDIGILHFVSDDTTIPPSDVSLKIGQSLKKMVDHVAKCGAAFSYSDAVAKYQGIYTSGNSSSLPVLKQLSIEHHIELMDQIV